VTGYCLGVVPKIKRSVKQEMLFTLCIIHREHLAAKKLLTDFKNVLTMWCKVLMELEVGS